MNKLALLFAAAALVAQGASADDMEGHILPRPFAEPKELRPEASGFDRDWFDAGRGFVVARDFTDFLLEGPYAAMIANPVDNFDFSGTEFAVKLSTGKASERALVGLELNIPAQKKHDASFEEAMTLRRSAPSRTCEVPIDKARAQRIDDVWYAMVAATRMPQASAERHGSYKETPPLPLEYHFFDDFGGTGRAVFPVPHLKPGVMALLGTAMFDYCMTKQPEALARMDSKLVELEGLLAKDGVNPNQ